MLRRIKRLVSVGSVALLGAVIVNELRKPAEDREWHGKLVGVVPYDLRPPTAERLRDGVWNGGNDSLFVPQVFGVGWTVNVGRVVRSLRER